MAPTTTTHYTPAQNLLSLIGRVLIALLFVPSGFSKLIGFSGTVGYITATGVPVPEVAAAAAVAVELGFALLLLVGWQTRWVALGMAVFTFVISFIFHNFWAADAAHYMSQYLNFYKNMAISGGLLAYSAFGAGGWSLDARRGDATTGNHNQYFNQHRTQ
jgi:putative oxidoreductase